MQSYYPVRKMRAEHRDHSRTSVAKRRAIERRKLRKIKEASRA